MPASPAIARGLNERGLIATHASERGMAMARDEEIIEVARQEGAVVITVDLDYPRLLALSEVSAPGVILFRGGDYSDHDMIELVARVLVHLSEEDLTGSFVVVDRDRIRRRRLPLK